MDRLKASILREKIDEALQQVSAEINTLREKLEALQREREELQDMLGEEGE